MPGPRAVQNLQIPHPRDCQGGQMPRSSRGGGGAGLRWNWLMHKRTNEVKIAVLLKMGLCEILQRAYFNFCFNTVLLSVIY